MKTKVQTSKSPPLKTTPLSQVIVAEMAKPTFDISPEFLKLAKQANREYAKGLGKTFGKVEDAVSHLINGNN